MFALALVQLLYILGFVNLACALSRNPLTPRQPRLASSSSLSPQSFPRVIKHVRTLKLNQPEGVKWPRTTSLRESRQTWWVFLVIYFSCGWLPTYTPTDEERQEKENAKRMAAERAEQRAKKKAIAQRKAVERKQAEARGKNRKSGKSTVLPCTESAYCWF